MAALEGGQAAVAASSGQAAQFMAIAAIARTGDNIVTSTCLYVSPFVLVSEMELKWSRAGRTTSSRYFLRSLAVRWLLFARRGD